MDNQHLIEMLVKLQAENAALKAAKPQRALTYKVSERGACSVYGLGRFPVTLYINQWQRLLGVSQDLLKFLQDNATNLSVKD